jgi:hypothetical protein
VRQPLKAMGRIAAETLLRRIRRLGTDGHCPETMVVPELIIRETTSTPPHGLPVPRLSLPRKNVRMRKRSRKS